MSEYTERLYRALKKEKKRVGSKLDIDLFMDVFYYFAEKSIENMEDDEELLKVLEDGSDDEMMGGLELALSEITAASKKKFESYSFDARATALMETSSMITCEMVSIINNNPGNINITEYEPQDRLDLVCDIARHFENSYASIKAYKDNYSELVEHYARRMLKKAFGL